MEVLTRCGSIIVRFPPLYLSLMWIWMLLFIKYATSKYCYIYLFFSIYEKDTVYINVQVVLKGHLFIQPEIHDEVGQLRLELQNTLAMYNQACEDLIYAQNMVRSWNINTLYYITTSRNVILLIRYLL